MVIDALRHADNQSGKMVSVVSGKANAEKMNKCNLVEGQIAAFYSIIKKEEFKYHKFSFSNEQKGKFEKWDYNSSNFDKVDPNFGLFKLAASMDLKEKSKDKFNKAEMKMMSIKYQVKCDETAFVVLVNKSDKTND